MQARALLLILISGVVIQLACSDNKTIQPASGEKALAVGVIAARYEPVAAFLEAPGTVQPRNRIALSSQINGFVTDMRVRLGDSVQPGQILATLDDRDAESQKAASQAAIVEAQAALSEARGACQAAVEMQAASKASAELANQTFGRYQQLFESRSVSPQELDEVRSRRDAAEAELASREAMVAASEERVKQVEARILQARARAARSEVIMSWTQIKAPSAGKIVERPADTGTAILPGTPLIVIESTVKPQVLADLPTESAGRLRIGMEVRIRSSETSAPVVGQVSEIVPVSDTAAHTLQFKVDLPASFVAPNGQFVRVDIPIGTRNALLVPRSAIRETGQLTGLFTVDDASRARFHLAKVAAYDSENVEVLAGVESGQKIIVALSDEIRDGTVVEIRS